MRSPRGFAATIVLLAGMSLAAFMALAFGAGAEIIIHLALGTSFLLIAFAVFDFKLPVWVAWVAGAATGVLAIVFLLQGASDITHSAPLMHFAFDLLGQRFEKLLGCVFLLWCVALLLIDSQGKTKVLGAVIMAAVLCVEIYGFGGSLPGMAKLVYVPLFFWLLLESFKPA
jgi:hypothetical protein